MLSESSEFNNSLSGFLLALETAAPTCIATHVDLLCVAGRIEESEICEGRRVCKIPSVDAFEEKGVCKVLPSLDALALTNVS